MCNTWRNVFLQSMKNNTLSVKKLMKNLILRTLRQLYTVSEIIILIRWVTPPQKVENLQFEFFLSFEILQFFKLFNFFKIFTVSFVFLHWLYIYGFMSSTAFTYGYFFKLHFLLSECDRTLPPLCYTQPNLFTNPSCVFYLKLVQNLHCVLVSWRNCERNFKTNLIEIFGFAAQTVPHPTIHLSIHPRSYMISTTQYVGDTCRVKEKGQGHVRPKIFGRTVFHRVYKYPSPLPHFIYSARSLLSHSSSSKPSAATTPSSPVRKSFAASTSSPSYSRRPRKSSLRHCRSYLPPPS